MPNLLSSLIALSLVAHPAPGGMPSSTPASNTVQAATAPAPKARSTATRAKRGAKAAPTPKAGTTPKTAAKPADCDAPAAKVAAATPVPVAADPLAPTLAPCAESKPRP